MFKKKSKKLLFLLSLLPFSLCFHTVNASDDDSSDENSSESQNQEKRKSKKKKSKKKKLPSKQDNLLPNNLHNNSPSSLLPILVQSNNPIISSMVSILPNLAIPTPNLELLPTLQTEPIFQATTQGLKRKTTESEIDIVKLLGRDIFPLISRYLSQNDLLSLLTTSKAMNKKWEYVDSFSFKKRIYHLDTFERYFNLLAEKCTSLKKLEISGDSIFLNKYQLDKLDKLSLNLFKLMRNNVFSSLKSLEIIDVGYKQDYHVEGNRRFNLDFRDFFHSLAQGHLQQLQNLSLYISQASNEQDLQNSENLELAMSKGYLVHLEVLELFSDTFYKEFLRVLSKSIQNRKLPKLSKLNISFLNVVEAFNDKFTVLEFFDSLQNIELIELKLTTTDDDKYDDDDYDEGKRGKEKSFLDALCTYLNSKASARLEVFQLSGNSESDFLSFIEKKSKILDVLSLHKHFSSLRELKFNYISFENIFPEFINLVDDCCFKFLINLDLSGNDLFLHHAHQLIDSVSREKLPCLKNLDLSGNPISCRGFVECLSNSIKSNPQIFLKLSQMNIPINVSQEDLEDDLKTMGHFISSSLFGFKYLKDLCFLLYLKAHERKDTLNLEQFDPKEITTLFIFIDQTQKNCLPNIEYICEREKSNAVQVILKDINEGYFLNLKRINIYVNPNLFILLMNIVYRDKLKNLEDLSFHFQDDLEDLSFQHQEKLIKFNIYILLFLLNKFVIENKFPKLKEFNLFCQKAIILKVFLGLFQFDSDHPFFKLPRVVGFVLHPDSELRKEDDSVTLKHIVLRW